MICPKCDSLNNDEAKFCSKCGAPLKAGENNAQVQQESFFQQNKILIICIAIIVVVAATVGIFAYSMTQVHLETQDFGAFSMSVPVGSNFIETFNSMGTPGGFITYENQGDHFHDAFYFDVSSSSLIIAPDSFELDSIDGDLTIYKSTDGNDGYIVYREVGGYTFGIMGFNLGVLKEMAKSIEVTGPISQSSSSSSSSTPSAPQSGSLKILGGNFYTGSELEDKTYAEIYVGPQHSGEKIYVQIFYSRDGKGLNNGNMVPVTVDSNGYVKVASAEAYQFYPDYATIKIYDSNQKLQDVKNVILSPTSGTQTF